jgi:hypothetical protein
MYAALLIVLGTSNSPAVEPAGLHVDAPAGVHAACDCCGSGCGGHPLSCRSTCDMPPHTPYLPELHGYYYFRPYNYTHVAEHQAFVKGFGADPRNPYSDGIFKKVYEQLGADEARGQAN